MLWLWLTLTLLPVPVQAGSDVTTKIRTLREGNQIRQAEEWVQQIFQRYQRNEVDSLHQLALTWMREFRFEEAIWLFRRFWLALPEYPVSAINYGLALRFAGRYSESETVFRWALDRFPNQGRIWNELGLLAQAQGEGQARNWFTRAFELGEKAGAQNQYLLHTRLGEPPPSPDPLEPLLEKDRPGAWTRRLFAFSRLDKEP